MSTKSFHILRIGLAITFIWIGYYIWQTPEVWGGYLQPWAASLLPMPLSQAMIGTAILDIVIGLMLLANIFTRLASFLAALHLLIVLIVSGINSITVRDIGLLAAALALFLK